MRSFKSILRRATSRHLAGCVLGGIDESITMELQRKVLKVTAVGWVAEAAAELRAKESLYESGWKHIAAEDDADRRQILEQAQADHEEGRLFRHAKQINGVPEEPPHGADAGMDPEAEQYEPEAEWDLFGGDLDSDDDEAVVEDPAEAVVEMPADAVMESPAAEAVVEIPAAEAVAEIPAAEAVVEVPAAAAFAEVEHRPDSNIMDKFMALRIIHGRYPTKPR